jgi:hypothetical protein
LCSSGASRVHLLYTARGQGEPPWAEAERPPEIPVPPPPEPSFPGVFIPRPTVGFGGRVVLGRLSYRLGPITKDKLPA